MIFEFRTPHVQRVRYAGLEAVMRTLARVAQREGFVIDVTELDSLRPEGMGGAVARRKTMLHVKIDLGEHAAGLPRQQQMELAEKILRECKSELEDGFVSRLAPLPRRRADRTQGMWIAVWDKERLAPTGLLIHTYDDEDASRQLAALAVLLEVDADALTICPPPGWQGFYGDPRLR